LDKETMENKYTPLDVIRRIESELDAGKTVRARTIIRLTTNIGIKESREIIAGRRKIEPHEVTNTDLDNLNRAGCSVGSAAFVVSLALASGLASYLLA
jgi:hypothetical protein